MAMSNDGLPNGWVECSFQRRTAIRATVREDGKII